MGDPKEVRPGRGGFHENPSTCICEHSVASKNIISGPRKFGKDVTKRNVVNGDSNVDNEPDSDDDEDQNDILEMGMFNETNSEYEVLNAEDNEIEEILSD